MEIRTKRVYDPPSDEDGCRVLVDRLWPRGVSKDEARIDHWLRDLAPSAELRKWFGHDPERWEDFRERYFRELDAGPEGLDELLALARQGLVTLVFGAKDTERNNAAALRDYLRARIEKQR